MDVTLDVLRGEARALEAALKRADEQLWIEVSRQQLAQAARGAAQFASARLTTMTQTPYVAAVDAAVARAAWAARAAKTQHHAQ